MLRTVSIFVFLLSTFSVEAMADDVRVAVAANFASPMEKIAASFTKESGHKVVSSSGSTGKFYAQIKEGAPFDVLLSADQEHPRKLSTENLALSESQFTYAIGKLVLWSAKEKFVDSKGEILKSGTFFHLSIANPKTAPYGAAAKEALEKKQLWKLLEPKLVYGESIAQAYQFVATGNADLGFVAYSQIKEAKNGSYWFVPQELYSPLKQDAILLAAGKNKAAAKQFLEFLKGAKARAIIEEFGYEK